MKNNLILSLVSILLCLPFSNILFAQKYRSEIIESKTRYQLKGDKIIESGSRVIQINNRMGDNDANVVIYYSKGDKVKIKEAWIQDVSGKVIRRLAKNEIVDVSAINSYTLFSDRFMKKFQLVYNQRPYQLVYSYEFERSKYLTIEHLDLNSASQRIRNAEIIIEAPTDKSILYFQKNINQPEVEIIENGLRYVWHYNYTPPQKFDLYADLNSFLAPNLIVVPQNFKYGVAGSFKSWQEFGNWMWRLNEGRNSLPDSEKIKIDKLVKDAVSPKEKARILYHYLQDNTRYVNVSTKIGGVQTHPAEYVCTNRYGDCKALTNYMQAMLKYVGIESYYTLIESSSIINDFDPTFPHDPFNHVILTLPLDKDTIFLECTSSNIAFGYVPTSNKGRKALIVDKDNSRLIHMPSSSIEDVKCTRHIEVNINNILVTGSLKTVLREDRYELYKYIQKGINKNIADNFIHENILSGSYTLDNYDFEEVNRDSVYAIFSTDFRLDNIVKKYGNNLIINPFSWNLASWEKPSDRNHGIRIDQPIYKEDTIVYTINNNVIHKIPEDIEIKSPYGFYSLKFNIDSEHKLSVNKVFKLYRGTYCIDEYEDFYKFVVEASNNENKNLYIEIL